MKNKCLLMNLEGFIFVKRSTFENQWYWCKVLKWVNHCEPVKWEFVFNMYTVIHSFRSFSDLEKNLQVSIWKKLKKLLCKAIFINYSGVNFINQSEVNFTNQPEVNFINHLPILSRHLLWNLKQGRHINSVHSL